MKINEVFLSVQGESINRSSNMNFKFGVGVPTVFVRTNRCDLACKYCDSAYTFGTEEIEMTPTEIVKKVEEVGGPYKVVCFTGGNPGIQPMGEVHQLIRGLKDKGYVISVEASGTEGRDFFFGADSIIMDIKGPSSGKRAMEKTKDNVIYWKSLAMYDQLKFLVKDRVDFDWMLNWIEKTNFFAHEIRPLVLVSPVFDNQGGNNAAQVVEWMLAEKLDCVLNLQIHKAIWPVNKRGV